MFSWVTDNLFFPISHPNLTRDGSFHGPTSEGTILTLLPQVPLPRAPEAAGHSSSMWGELQKCPHLHGEPQKASPHQQEKVGRLVEAGLMLVSRLGAHMPSQQ